MLSRRRRATAPRTVEPWPFVGMILMAAAFFLYAASGLVAPWWGVVLLVLVWIALFVLCCAWWTPHPRRLVWVALFAFVFWFGALTAGGAFLGWTA
ncbi:hypothetical protein NPS01_32260 [Nocardioides psychrotolerans]|uniref:DUF4175 domain-containing protein n=1 Tax=Nocardioides psychrotolerans TaxID=1005945 RepID=A0A1I3P0Z4_9ACTN|nr:hypothetical protein [Nocardioides psychrotolerans]GEP39563.1 hypothetical protein NPS01_32260 [Nocardioides psychrotolerans]SFJ15057.1 hypothetical protein SAMN05216561_11948 [Nocardioides psychrotolerans]